MAEVKIGRLVVGSYGTNCYILYREGSNEVIFIDPAQHGEMIYQKLQQKGMVVKGILLTHAHFDHIGGASTLR